MVNGNPRDSENLVEAESLPGGGGLVCVFRWNAGVRGDFQRKVKGKSTFWVASDICPALPGDDCSCFRTENPQKSRFFGACGAKMGPAGTIFAPQAIS